MNSAWIYAALLLTFASKNAYSQAPSVDEHRNRPDPRSSLNVEHPSPFAGPNRPPFSNRGSDQPSVNGQAGSGDSTPPANNSSTPPPTQRNDAPTTPDPSAKSPPNAKAPSNAKSPPNAKASPPSASGPTPPTSPNTRTPKGPNTTTPRPGGGCRRIVRQEIKDLSANDRQRYWTAIKGIMRRNGNGPSTYDLLTKDHDDYNPLNHGTPLFLVWHRVFIRKFEVAIQRVDSSVAAHYWDWSADAQAPELSVIFSSSWYGSNGDQRRGNCVSNGQFSSFQPFYRSGSSCLTRSFNRGSRIGSFVAPEVLSRYVSGSRSYDSFRLAIEGQPHAAVHNGIGSGFSTMRSPNDPIFWLHHTFVDKLYMDWQLQNPRRFGEVNGRNVNGYTMMKPWNERASLGASAEIYGGCISYAAAANAFRGGRQQQPRGGPTINRGRNNDDQEEEEEEEDNGGWNQRPSRGNGWNQRPSRGNGWNQQPPRGNGWNVPNRGGPIRWVQPIRPTRGPINFSPRPMPIRRGRWQRRQLDDEEVVATTTTTTTTAEDNSTITADDNVEAVGAETNVTAVDAMPNNSTITDDETAGNDSLIEVVKDPAPEDVPDMCYDSNGVEILCADDRENILDLRSPVPIPEEYLRMNNQNVTYIRAQEAETRKVVKKLNNLEGYVSPCALLNREDFLVKLAKKGTEFKQVVKGKLVKVHLDKKARKAPHTFVEKLKRQFTRIGYNVVKSYDSIQSGIRRILGSGTKYMYNHFHHQKGSVYYEEDEEEQEYCED